MSGRSALAIVVLAWIAATAPARAQSLQPPQVIALAPVELDAARVAEVGASIEVRVIVDRDGRASLDHDVMEPGLRGAVEDAIARSRIAPATRDGTAIVARARVRLDVRAREVAPAPVIEPPPIEPSFRALARTTPEPTSAMILEAEEVRDLPGLQGDPFRVVETLPGVVPLLSGLPFLYVRGAPPAGTITLWDDIPVPSLFHVAAGPSTIHAARLGEMRLWPGVAPARYGRHVGGVVLGAAAPIEPRLGGEVELRLLDVNGMITVPIDRRHVVQASGRYGYPGWIVGAALPGVELDYWDYQLTADLDDGHGGHTRLIALGAYDRLRQDLTDIETLGEQSDVLLHFHRVEARHVRSLGGGAEFGAALRLGYDQSQLGEAVGVEVWSASPRLWSSFALGFARLRVGADLVASGGRIESGRSDDPAIAGALIREGAYSGARTRTAAGAYVEALLPIPGVLRLELGARIDTWVTAREVQVAPSPRARLVVHVWEGVDLHAAMGLAHQPAVLFLPLPGFADLAVDRGLQRSLQSDWGISLALPLGISLEAQGFFHYFDQVLLPDLYVQDREICVQSWCTQVELDPRARARVLGLEVLARRDGRDVSGWISYTLSEATARAHEGFEFVPGFDVRHVIQAMGRARIWEGLEIAIRVLVRSGRVVGRYFIEPTQLTAQRYEQRLPWFFRGDAEIAYAWDAGWGRLRVSLGWTNVTLSEEPIALECNHDSNGRPEAPCAVQTAPPIFLPSLGIRAEL
ncbi:TonB-dependent receptor [Sandaracinus amylolyticus]|uniref:TonB-dependent receptor n=1 Tax=Sandaracinus amylolyticus TaxID=927083 RepID=UPI001F166CC7|nr:TonB-dependent receptor [Sandaracinus amylolyticus]UJR78157.1 TonB family protein / TonB-dependent receptor [Sandaracinus amylolyticus]